MLWPWLFPGWGEAGVALLRAWHFADKKAKLDVFSAVETLSFLEGTWTGMSVTGVEWRLGGTACVFGGGVECPEALPSRQSMRCSAHWWGAGGSAKSGQHPEQDGKGLILHHREGVGRKALPTRPCQDIHMLYLSGFFFFHLFVCHLFQRQSWITRGK